MSRVACLAVPLFPLAARLRSEPDLAGERGDVVEEQAIPPEVANIGEQTGSG